MQNAKLIYILDRVQYIPFRIETAMFVSKKKEIIIEYCNKNLIKVYEYSIMSSKEEYFDNTQTPHYKLSQITELL